MIADSNFKKCVGCENLINLPTKKNFCCGKCYRKFNSNRWYLENKVTIIREEKNCKCCNNLFTPKTNISKYCSSKCLHKDWHREKSGFYDIKPRNCKFCNELFTPKKGKNTKFCSGKNCSSKYYAITHTDEIKLLAKLREKRRKEADPEEFLRKKREESKRNRKWSNIKRNFGLTKKDYFNLLESQNNKCKICTNTLIPGKLTHIDHCHETNEVRGILCQYCNQGLGLFKDNIESLYSAINYLKQSKKYLNV